MGQPRHQAPRLADTATSTGEKPGPSTRFSLREALSKPRNAVGRGMADWLRTNRAWLVPSLVITGVIILLFSYTLHIQHEKQEQSDEIVTEKAVSGPQAKKAAEPKQLQAHQAPSNGEESTPAPQNIQARQSNPPVPKEHPAPVTKSEPKAVSSAPVSSQATKTGPSEKSSPEEVIQRLEGLAPDKLKAEEQKLIGLHVSWSVYLFSAKKKGEDAFTVTFDSSETGFGVIIVSQIDLLKYIGIVAARQGDRILLGGTIAGMDANGTGRIDLKVDSINLADR
jgi:hypothetical protein